MANSITWEKPLLTSSWTHTKIERSTSQAGIYVEIGSVAIATSTYFDINGTSSSWYRIRFYDSSQLIYSDYSTPLQGTTDTNVFKYNITAVTVLGTLGANGPDSNNDYTLFGMKINQNVAQSIVEQCYNYTTELIGESAIIQTDNSTVRKVTGFVTNYSALRILGILAGVSITTHFNYSAGGLNIQKPAVGQIRAMLDMYSWETRRWSKLLLTRSRVSTQTDMDMSIINEQEPEGSGIAIITYDAKNL